MDLNDLRAVIEDGATIEEAAEFLCRSGTVGEVRRMARELGLLAAKPLQPGSPARTCLS